MLRPAFTHAAAGIRKIAPQIGGEYRKQQHTGQKRQHAAPAQHHQQRCPCHHQHRFQAEVFFAYCRGNAQHRDTHDQTQIGRYRSHRVAHSQIHLALKHARHGYRQLRQRGGQRHDGRTDNKPRHAGGLRDPHRPIQKPVAALNDQCQSNDEQQYGNPNVHNFIRPLITLCNAVIYLL